MLLTRGGRLEQPPVLLEDQSVLDQQQPRLIRKPTIFGYEPMARDLFDSIIPAHRPQIIGGKSFRG
jgi:hypothetical protein